MSRGDAVRPDVRIVQITSARVDNNHATQCNWILHALDNVGRIWELTDTREWREVQLPNVDKVQP